LLALGGPESGLPKLFRGWACGLRALAIVVVLVELEPPGLRSSGKMTCARVAASRMICASICERVSAIPAAGQPHTNARGSGD
jgi:hypothetical protein